MQVLPALEVAEIAGELALGEADELVDMTELCDGLEEVLADAPGDVVAAFADARSRATVASLGVLIDRAYAWGGAEPAVARPLELIRPVLRRDIDRKMEIAG